MLGTVRDYIKLKRMTVNEAFGIEGLNQELELNVFAFKRRLK